MSSHAERRRQKWLLVAQAQPAHAKGLLHLFDALAAEVRHRAQLVLGLLHEVADRLHTRPLQTVVRAHAELELLDQDVVHAVRDARRAEPARGLAGAVRGRKAEAL